MGIFSRCKDILASNINYKKAKKNTVDMEKLLGKVKAEKLAYDTKFSRMQTQMAEFDDDIEKYKRYLGRVSGSQATTIQAQLSLAEKKKADLEPSYVIVEKQCAVISATLQKLQADMEGIPDKAYVNAEELQSMADMAASLSELDTNSELDELMKKYD